MGTSSLIDKLFNRARPGWVLLAACVSLAGVYGMPRTLAPIIKEEKRFQENLSHFLEQAATAHEHRASLELLKTADLEQLKAGIGGHALSEKTLFEAGISLQEERRLLEKQLEIMTTTLLVNPALQRVFLMRADQVFQSYLISYIPVRSFGGAPTALSAAVRIVSKERFAHPERGKSEEVNGTLQWVPPQVGTSLRSKALGEYVMFTNSPLILHGPPVNAEDHERFSHICLGVGHEEARKLYRASFIGTKIALSNVAIEKSTFDIPASSAASGSDPVRP